MASERTDDVKVEERDDLLIMIGQERYDEASPGEKKILLYMADEFDKDPNLKYLFDNVHVFGGHESIGNLDFQEALLNIKGDLKISGIKFMVELFNYLRENPDFGIQIAFHLFMVSDDAREVISESDAFQDTIGSLEDLDFEDEKNRKDSERKLLDVLYSLIAEPDNLFQEGEGLVVGLLYHLDVFKGNINDIINKIMELDFPLKMEDLLLELASYKGHSVRDLIRLGLSADQTDSALRRTASNKYFDPNVFSIIGSYWKRSK